MSNRVENRSIYFSYLRIIQEKPETFDNVSGFFWLNIIDLNVQIRMIQLVQVI